MKQWVGYVLLALCLVLAYQGYGNVQNGAATEAMARSQACEGIAKCTVTRDAPRVFKSNILSRRYEWITSAGPVTTTCRRGLVFFGAWTCSSEAGPMPTP